MKIYVACLSAYNNGHLHGEWIDASNDVEEMQEAINAMMKKSPMPDAEEWAIHDFEGFGSLNLSEYTGLDRIAEYADFHDEHGDLGMELLAHFNDIGDAREAIENFYQGEFKDEVDFAYYYTHELNCREIPDYLTHYVDYAAMARDLFINDYYTIELDHKIHVFSHN